MTRHAFVPVSHAANFVAVDDRFVTYATIDATAVRVLDTKLGTEKQIPLPENCILGAPLSAAGGRFLVQCPDGSRLVDDQTGEVVWGPMLASSFPGDWRDNQWMVMGEQWLRTFQDDDYLNWHTGERRTVTGEIPDLSDPDLRAKTFCAPFQKESRQLHNQQYNGNVLLVHGQSILLGRCGQTGSARRIGTGLAVPSLNGGWATWIAPKRKGTRCKTKVNAYDLASKTRKQWIHPPFPGSHCAVGLAHTRYAVLVLRRASYDDLGSLRIDRYRMAWSKRPA